MRGATSPENIGEAGLDDFLRGISWQDLAAVAAPFFGGSSQQASGFLDTLRAEAHLGLRLIKPFLSPGARILEVGSGMGLLAGYLGSRGLGITALEPGLGGFGVSAALARAVQDRPEFAGLSRLDLPAEQLSPQTHGKFDFIYSVNVLEHIPLLEDALSAMGSALADGGTMLHTCPNYTVPYEPHFGVALIPFFPRWTGPLFGKGGHEELWDSLNFITAGRVKRICRRHAMSVEFQPGVLHQAFLRLEQDPEFRKRQSSGPVVRLFLFLKASGLLSLLRFVPPTLSTPMVFRIRKA